MKLFSNIRALQVSAFSLQFRGDLAISNNLTKSVKERDESSSGWWRKPKQASTRTTLFYLKGWPGFFHTMTGRHATLNLFPKFLCSSFNFLDLSQCSLKLRWRF